MTPIGLPIAGSDFSMSGYDMDFACVRGACASLHVRYADSRSRACGSSRSRLVFGRMLNLNLTYVAAATFVEMYQALRSGDCDVGITAVEMCVCCRSAVCAFWQSRRCRS
jgi:hypothetical protein